MSIKGENHRTDFETCPHCSHEFDHEAWVGSASSMSLSLGAYSKTSSCMISSDCPRCSGDSWIHVELRGFEWTDYPERFKKRAAKEFAKRSLKALRDWGHGICHGCDLLESGVIDTKAWKYCPCGSGPPKTECDSFEPVS